MFVIACMREQVQFDILVNEENINDNLSSIYDLARPMTSLTSFIVMAASSDACAAPFASTLSIYS